MPLDQYEYEKAKLISYASQIGYEGILFYETIDARRNPVWAFSIEIGPHAPVHITSPDFDLLIRLGYIFLEMMEREQNP